MNAGIKDYGGGWGKIAGRVNVRGAWDWDRGRIPKASRRNGGRGMTQKMARSFHEAMKAESVQKTRRANMKIGMNIFS